MDSVQKLFYYDIETTGTKHWKNGIHQISGSIEIDGVIKEEFDFKVRPNPKALIEQEALDVGTGVTMDQIMAYPHMIEVYAEITAMLRKYVDKYNKRDKFFQVGYNAASFDSAFFRAFFKQNNDEYFGSWFWSDVIDVRVLAIEFLKKSRHKMIDFKLATVAKYLGIEVDDSKLHDGKYDIWLTKEIYKKITK